MPRARFRDSWLAGHRSSAFRHPIEPREAGGGLPETVPPVCDRRDLEDCHPGCRRSRVPETLILAVALFCVAPASGEVSRLTDPMGLSSGEGVRPLGESSSPSGQGTFPSDQGVPPAGQYAVPSDEEAVPSDLTVGPLGEDAGPSDESAEASDEGVAPSDGGTPASDEVAIPSDEGVLPSDE